MLRSLATEARALEPREAWRRILDGFADNDLLTYASAISFQVFFALIPTALLVLGLLGSFGLSEVWTSDVAPKVHDGTSPAAFQVIDSTVKQVLGQRQLFWATAGALIAIWEVSGAMRATMQVLNRIYDIEDTRTFWRRVGVSIWLSALVTALLLLAVAAVNGIPLLIDVAGVGRVAGWVVALVLLAVTVAAIVRFAPAAERPMRWVSFGALVVIVGWVLASLVYGWYVTSLADYGSLFGSLSVVIVTLTYLYLSSIVFLTGLQLDSLIRARIEEQERDDRSGHESPVIVASSLASVQDELRRGSDGVHVAGHEQGGDERLAPGL